MQGRPFSKRCGVPKHMQGSARGLGGFFSSFLPRISEGKKGRLVSHRQTRLLSLPGALSRCASQCVSRCLAMLQPSQGGVVSPRLRCPRTSPPPFFRIHKNKQPKNGSQNRCQSRFWQIPARRGRLSFRNGDLHRQRSRLFCVVFKFLHLCTPHCGTRP